MNNINYTREKPDVETSSNDYAHRFSGRAGTYFLKIQRQSIDSVLSGSVDSAVLDVGGGHGQLVRTLLERRCRVTVLGSMLCCHDRLRSHIESGAINFVTGDLLHLPFKDNSYDIVIAVRLISHVQNWSRLISEFCRIAKHLVVLDYPSILSLNILTPALFGLKKVLEGNTRTYRSFLERELTEEFRKHGFYVSARQKQFFLPMFVHRALDGVPLLQFLETLFRRLGITALLGSPVILRLERRQSNFQDQAKHR
jgi:ubiquinone/menaquinone biosynthesis C-methylase UbiE